MRRGISFWAASVLVSTLVAACSLDLNHYGAYDPESPAEKKAKSTVSGLIELDGETDFSSVDIQLQNSSRTYTVQSDANGAFHLTGVVPDEYALSYSTRYFAPVSDTVVIGIGKKVTLPNVTLKPKRSTVKGKATAERLVNRQFVGEGGVVIVLEKSSSIRGGGSGAPLVTDFLPASVDLPADGTISNGDGSFELSGVPAGIYVVIASSSGLSTIRVGSVKVTGEQDVTVEPITLRAVSGFFDILGTADYDEISSRYTHDPLVTLRLSGFNASDMMLGETSTGLPEDCLFHPKEPFVGVKPYLLTKQGENILCVKYIAEDGRESGVQTGAILYDPNPPATFSDSLKVLNAVDGFTQTFTLALELKSEDLPAETESGLVKMQILDVPFGDPQPSFASAVTLPYLGRPTYTLPATDGPRTVWVRFADRAGNYSQPVSASVTLDRVAPNYSLVELRDHFGNLVDLNNPTNTNQINLHLTASDASPMFVAISDRSDFLGASWAPYQVTMAVNNIQAATNPLGNERSVFVRIKDAAGHVVDLGEYKFIVDTIAPAIVNMSIQGQGVFPGNKLATTTTVSVNFTYQPDDTVLIDLSADGGFQNKVTLTAPNSAASTSTTFPISTGDGVKFLYARFRDKAGNVSSTVIDQIVLDTVPPQLTSLDIQGGAYTQLTQVNLLTGAADAAQMLVSESPNCAGSWLTDGEQYATSKAKNYLTLTEELKTFSVKYRDAAGNESACIAKSVRFDKTPPAIPPPTLISGVLTPSFRAMNSNYATITTTNVLRYYIGLAVTDASPVTVQFDSTGISWTGVPKEEVRPVRAWDVERPSDPAGELRYTYVRIEDAAGNVFIPPPLQVTVALLNASLELPVYTADPNVSIVFGSSNANSLWLDDLPNYPAPNAYALAATQTTVMYTLPSGDGVKTVYGRFFDSQGGHADTLANTILDTQPPVPTGFVIDSGNSFTNNTGGAVALTASATDGSSFVQSVRLANITLPGQSCSAALAAPGAVTRSYPLADTSWTLASPIGTNIEGPRWVCVQFADVLNQWSAPISDAIQYDTLVPQVGGGAGIFINNSDPFTKSLWVSLALPVTGASYMRLGNNNAAFGSWVAYASVYQWALDNFEGLQNVRVEFLDAAGNMAGPYQATSTVDRIAPTGGTFGINFGAAFTNSTQVSLQTFAGGAVTMEVSNGASFSGASTFAYATAVDPWALSSTQGLQTVWVRYTDVAENTTVPISATITYDSVAPYNTSVVIDNGAANTNATNGLVTLALNAQDLTTSLDQYKVASLPAGQTCAQVLSAAAPAAYGTSVSNWPLDNFGANLEGTRYVCAQFKDMAGNWSSPVSDAIQYDTLVPQVGAGPGIYINSGNAYSNSLAVTLALPVTGASTMELANDSDPFGAPVAYSSLVNGWVLPNSDGAHQVHVRFSDAAGNLSPVYTASITLDRLPPSGDTLGINFGAAFTNSTTVSLQTFANTAVTMEVSNGSSFAGASVYAYATSVNPWTLANVQGAQTVWARYTDIAGNTSTPISATITYDSVAPQSASILIDSGATYSTDVTGNVSLSLAATDLGSAVANMKVANKPVGQTCAQTLAAVSSQSFAASLINWQLLDVGSNKQGDRYVCAQFQDTAGNWSAPVSDAVTYDTVPPDVGGGNGVYIDSAAAYSTDAGGYVSLSFAVTGATQVRVANDGGPSTGWMSLGDPQLSVWQLADSTPASDGAHTVSVDFIDDAGNIVGPFTASITFDRQAPTAGSIVINSNAGLTNSTSVNLALSAAGGPVKMDISNSAFFTTFTQSTYATTQNGWLLTSSQGSKEVWVRFIDVANNFSTPVSDTIGYDSLAPVAGTLLINGGNPGAVTKDTSVSLTLAVSDANNIEVNLSHTACGAGSYAALSSPQAYVLPSTGDATYTIYARYRDAVLNETLGCATAAVRIDTVVDAPSFAVSFTGPAVYAGYTSLATAPLVPANIGSDAVSMVTSPTGAFTEYGPRAIGTVAVALPTDGAYTYSVKLRDAATNESAVYTASIIRESQPPATPVLSIADTTGDWLAYSTTGVELSWTPPVDADIAGYILQRKVGAGAFTTIANLSCTGTCAGSTQYTDTFGTSGQLHEYRVLALDWLGNRSAYSTSVATTPVQPLGRIFQVRNTEQYEYFFAPTAPATFTAGRYEWDSGNVIVSSVMYSILNYAPAATRWNEKLILPVAEPSAADLYESEFPLRRSMRETIDTAGQPGRGSAVAVDQYGYSHIVYRHEAPVGLYYATNKTGAWVSSLITSEDGDYPVIAVARDGRVHIAYYDKTGFDLKYTSMLSGSWSAPISLVNGTDASNDQGRWAAMALGSDGRLHLSFVQIVAGVATRRYMVRSSGGAWGLPVTVEALGAYTAGQELAASLRMSSVTNVELAYYHAGSRELHAATSSDSLTFITGVLDTTGDAGQFNSMSVGLNGDLYVGYVETGTQELRYIKRSAGVWSNAVTLSTAPAPVTGQVSLVVDRNDKIHISYWRQGVGLELMSNGDGAWKSYDIDTADDAGEFNSMTADSRGKLYFAYSAAGTSGLRYATTDRFASHTETVVGAGVAASAMAVDVTGTVHLVYRSGTDLFYTTNAAGTWSTPVDVDGGKTVNSNPAITLDPSSLPHIVYLDNSSDAWYRKLQADGTWTSALIVNAENVEKTYANFHGPAIVVDANYQVYIAYLKDNAYARFAQKTSGGATFSVSNLLNNGNQSKTLSLALNKSATDVYATWWDNTGTDSDDMEFGRYSGGAWGGEVDVIANDTTISQPIVRVGSDDLPRIVYVKSNTIRVITASNTSGTTWTSPVQVDAFTSPSDVSFTMASDDSLHILAYDATNGLRYITNQTGSWVGRYLVSGTTTGSTGMIGFDQAGIPRASLVDNGALKYLTAFSGWLPASSIVPLR